MTPAGFARYDALLARTETALTDRPRAGASNETN